MDRPQLKQKAESLFRRYKYFIVILIFGIFLMSLPEKGNRIATINHDQYPEERGSIPLDESLSDMLSHVTGAGKVRVLLSVNQGEMILYQTDNTESSQENSESVRSDTVLISSSDRTQKGLVKQVNPPKYLGAFVLCQGADHSAVKLSIIEAVSNITGIPTNRITVLKMK